MEVGAEIGDYLVIEHIGRGGMADVWSARDRRLNRTVAIKTIARNLSQTGEEVLALFKREAETIARLEHPHILPIYAFGEIESQLYLVMRYVAGGSVEDVLARGPLAPVDVLRIGRAVAGALDHAHDQQVVHLDIKPSNILLDSGGQPYLADFGLATVMQGPEGRARNPGYGTLLYMAPEQLTSSEIDYRADIYSFAILIYHMLTGELPFDATTSLAIKQLQSQEDLPAITQMHPHLPPALTQVLRRATAIQPSRRHPNAGALVAEIEGLLTGVSIPVAGPGRSPGVTTIILPDPEQMGPPHPGDVGATIDLGEIMPLLSANDMIRHEAEDLYMRARRAWAFGQGRFLMGITHFMLVCDFYIHADQHQLELDMAGKQMLLRGALEYDHEVAYWWDQLDDANRRWVVLHAIRSDSALARARAIYRLESLPDAQPPRIVAQVSQALQAETDPAVRRAAIHVLVARAPLTPSDGAQTLLLRDDGTGNPGPVVGDAWRESIYTPQIEGLVAEIALADPSPAIAEQAARAIGQMRSLTALHALVMAQRAGRPGALRALALARDEAPSLPPEVGGRARLYAWLYNGWRRISARPMQVVWRYALALIGAAVAMGGYAWVNLTGPAVLFNEIIGRTISTALTFGLCVGAVVVLAGEIPARLRGFWRPEALLLLGAALGTAAGVVTWALYAWLLLYQPLAFLELHTLALGGLGLALGFTLASVLRLRAWQAVPLTAALIFGALALAVTQPALFSTDIVYFIDDSALLSQGLFLALFIALGGHARAVWADLYALARVIRA